MFGKGKVDIPCMVEERWSKISGKLGQKFRRYQGDDESEMKRININAIGPYLI